MHNFKKLTSLGMLKIPDITLDYFQKQVLENTHLEFSLANGVALISPKSSKPKIIGEISATEQQEIENIVKNDEEILYKIRRYLIYDLIHYSSILETNSFYIKLNQYLLITRFIQDPNNTDKFEVKLYTISENDLSARHGDKLYLGRDIISLKTLRKDFFGLDFIEYSLREQMHKVKERVFQEDQKQDQIDFESEYFKDIENLIEEFTKYSQNIFNNFPSDLDSQNVERSTLIAVNRHFIDLKHILIDIEQSLQDLETKMFEHSMMHPVRYVTKFKKDITNDINYLMFKVNGRISDCINAIKV